jgi:hypothetical protein
LFVLTVLNIFDKQILLERIYMLESDWKMRAIDRRIENKKLKKKCKELTISRDGWKEKAIKRKADVNVLNKQLLVVKKNIQKIANI